MSLFDTGIRPLVDEYLLEKSKEVRDYGDYWSASSAGLCMRLNIFRRLQVPPVTEDARRQRVFTAGHIFHSWMQGITKAAGISLAQELELQDEELMIRGHIDDLVRIDDKLMLIDYKTQNSRAFSYKRDAMSHYHRMQLGTYMYMLRSFPKEKDGWEGEKNKILASYKIWDLSEARILKISKDDLRMSEEQLLWSDELEKEVVEYWKELNSCWEQKLFPKCTCADYEGGFLAKEAWNDYFYNGEPCSIEYYEKWKKEKENG